jgi:hypothetical protein
MPGGGCERKALNLFQRCRMRVKACIVNQAATVLPIALRKNAADPDRFARGAECYSSVTPSI